MSISTNVPAITITPQGVTVPETEEILTGVLDDYNTAFGGTLNIVNVGTPQGVLAAEETQAISLQNASVAYTLTQFDPATAEGRYQDALGRIYFMTRRPGTSTVVAATCNGAPGVLLPKGSQAKDTQGYIYSSLVDVSFDRQGLATVQFANDTPGAIPCAVNSLVYIETTVPGWDSITNESAGIIGTDIENRQNFENRRSATVSANAKSSTEAIFGAVNNLAGVLDCIVRENNTSQTVEMGATNYPLLPHSVYVGVVGGDNNEIAQMIWTKKSNGCDTNGNVSVTVQDKAGYVAPFPEYVIKFNRPTPISVSVKVTISGNPLLPSDIEQQVKNAVLGCFNGTLGGGKIRMGSIMYASRFYCPVLSISSYINIENIEVSTDGTFVDSIEFGIDQEPTLDISNITVIVQ